MGFVLLFAWQCNSTPVSPSIKQYSNWIPIVNPPDTFQVIYSLNSYGDKTATITFADSSVWQIKILSDSRMLFGVIHPDSVWKAIHPVDTIGFRGNVQYLFVASNSSTGNPGSYFVQGNYFVQFTKLPINYTSFSRKY